MTERYLVDGDTKYIGTHLVLDMFQIDQTFKVDDLLAVFCNACGDAGATVLSTKIQDFGEGCGTTGVIILAESHLSWHHYPEYQSMYVDVFTCGNTNPEKAIPRILLFLTPKTHNQQVIRRGIVQNA